MCKIEIFQILLCNINFANKKIILHLFLKKIYKSVLSLEKLRLNIYHPSNNKLHHFFPLLNKER